MYMMEIGPDLSKGSTNGIGSSKRKRRKNMESEQGILRRYLIEMDSEEDDKL